MVGRLFNRPGKPQHEFPQQFAPSSPSGHYLWPLQRVQITRAEIQPRLADHYSRLFFGRTAAAQIGQPFFSWQPTRRIEEPEPIAWRADHTLLHQFRETFQTVGQPWSTWQPYRQPSFEPEQIKQPVTDLYPYRQFAPAAAVSQPFWIWQTGRLPDFGTERIVSPQYDLYPYRQITITAGPGQPWYLWPPIQITIQPEEQMVRENHDLSLYPFRPHDASQPIPPPPIIVPPETDQGGVRHAPPVTQNVRHEKTLFERELERKKLFRKKKIRYMLPPEQQQIVEESVKVAASSAVLDDGAVSRREIDAKVRYVEELSRWLLDAEKLTAKTLDDLWSLDVAARRQEVAQQLEEEEAVAILAAWWMND